jgi:hypothetical protein
VTIHLPPLFTILGVLAATTIVCYIVFGLFMLWAWGSDWATRLVIPTLLGVAVGCWIFFWKLAT